MKLFFLSLWVLHWMQHTSMYVFIWFDNIWASFSLVFLSGDEKYACQSVKKAPASGGCAPWPPLFGRGARPHPEHPPPPHEKCYSLGGWQLWGSDVRTKLTQREKSHLTGTQSWILWFSRTAAYPKGYFIPCCLFVCLAFFMKSDN